MRKAAAVVLLLACVTAARAGEFKLLPAKGIGFIGPTPDAAKPETATCGNFGYSGSVGFPYRNRCIVVDLGRVVLAHKLVMLDDLKDDGGASPTISKFLTLYTSSDNRRYERYTGPSRIALRRGEAEGVYDVAEISGLAVLARYVKLHADCPDTRWDFGHSLLQKMVLAYQDTALAARIESVALPRYAAGEAMLRAKVHWPKGCAGPLKLRVSGLGKSEAVCFDVPASGLVAHELSLAGCPPGPRRLSVGLLNQEGMEIDRREPAMYVVSKIVANPSQPLAAQAGALTMLTNWPLYAAPRPTGWTTTAVALATDEKPRVLLVAGPGARPLRLRLPARGWHAVALGLVGGDSVVQGELCPGGSPKPLRLQVWRDHEKAPGLGEALVSCEDLREHELVLRPRKGKPCRLAFVRLLGLSPEQVRLVQEARRPASRGRVTVNNDGYSMFFSGLNSKERLHRLIDRYAGRRLHSYDYCLGSDATCTYDTKVGTVFGTNVDKFWRQGDRRAYEGIQKLISEGNDPLRVVIDRCRAKGLRVHVSFRMNANYAPPIGKTMNSRLYWDNLDCRLFTYYKARRHQLSYAYPQVRAYRLAVIKEGLSYGPDGLHLDFLRHPPFVGHDKPIVDAFKAKYGEDPFADPQDPRWLAMQAEVMTGFVRAVRRTLDEASRRQGRRMELTTSFDYRGYRLQALDVERWAREGLVDQISPGVHGLGGNPFSVAEFAKIVEGTKCRLFVRIEHTIQGHDPTPESERGEVKFHREHMTLNLYRRRALELYDEGAEGFYLFNTSGLGYINALSDVAGLRAWNALERPLVGWFEALDGAEPLQ